MELVRSIYAAWEHGDWSASDWADTEIELVRASPFTRGIACAGMRAGHGSPTPM